MFLNRKAPRSRGAFCVRNGKLRFVGQLPFAFVGQGYGLAVNDPDRNRLVFAARHSIYKYFLAQKLQPGRKGHSLSLQ